jgi:hypothetical protein
MCTEQQRKILVHKNNKVYPLCYDKELSLQLIEASLSLEDVECCAVYCEDGLSVPDIAHHDVDIPLKAVTDSAVVYYAVKDLTRIRKALRQTRTETKA